MSVPAILFFVLFTAMGIPLAVGSSVAAGIAAMVFGDYSKPLFLLVHNMIEPFQSFTFLCVPLFILCGKLMNSSSITDRIFNFARILVGRVPGGLAHANVVASMIFAGMSGSALADAGGLGQVEIRAMTDQGYKREFAVSLTAASATIGPIIPPSITMIVYAGLAEESIGRLFLGGCIPGLLMGISLMVLTVFFAHKHNFPKAGKVTRAEFTDTLLRAVPPLLTPVIIFGGIILGIFTVTEAAAVAALYAFLLGWLGYREITLKELPGILAETMIMTSVIMFVLATITGISWILVDEDVTVELAAAISRFSQNPTVVLALLTLVVLALGCVLEGAPIMVLCVPVMLPIVRQVGISGVHFGVVFSVACMVGMITPPVGMVLFVISEVSGLPLEKLMRAVIPFVFPLLVVLAITVFIPGTVMFLPDLLMNR